jgi:predicted PurR-regulated permease PerM
MPFVQWITRLRIRNWHPSRGIAVAVLLLTVACSLTAFFLLFLPPVIHNLHQFLAELPQRGPQVLDRLQRSRLATELSLPNITERLQNTAAQAANYTLASLPQAASNLMDVLTTIVLTVYFMLEGEHAYRWLLSLFASAQRQRLDKTLRGASLLMERWLLGQVLLMLILGLCSIVIFSLLHVRYSILLGVLMGLLNIVPVAGAVIGVLFAALVAAFDSWTRMAGVLIFYVIYFQIENAYLVPRIMRTSVNLMGLAIIIALLCGIALAGLVGAMVAVPTAALIAVLLDEYFVSPHAT